jgi:5-methylcytosine-specific restriction endonuclease McrA
MRDYKDLLRTISSFMADYMESPDEVRPLINQVARDLRRTHWQPLIEDHKERREASLERREEFRKQWEATRHVRILDNQLRRARKAGVAATLTLEQWEATLHYFQWKCAYCRLRPYDAMEHFLSITVGGGTTATNCIPACHSCNNKKHNYPPDKLAQRFSQESITYIQQYLTSQ